MCERCESPLDPALNWCARCFQSAPWAPPGWRGSAADASDWPDIWDGVDATSQLFGFLGEEDVSELAEALEPRSRFFDSLGRVAATVAVLVGLAELSALYAPGRTLGMASLVTLASVALLVVHQAWRSEPGPG